MTISHTSLKISGIRISCSKSKKLRVVVSVKSASTQGKALQLLDAQSEEKKDQLFRQISPSCVLEAGCQLTVAVYELHSWRSDKKLGEQGFSFDTLRQVSSSPSESEVYELFSKDGVAMSVKLEQDQAEGAKASESGAKGRNSKDSVLSNLRASLEIVQQVGKIVESVPFIEPIGAILSTLVDVYKEVKETLGKREALVEKAAALARDIFQAIVQLKNLNHVDLIHRLNSDLEEYLGLIRDVQHRVTETFDDHGKLGRVLKRAELGGEVDSLNDKLSFLGTRFRNNRLVDIQIEQSAMAGNVRKILDTALDARLEKWLNVPDQNDTQSHFSGIQNRSPGQWFFEHHKFIRWQDNPGELLWIEGASGTGKTIVSSMIIEQLFKDRASLTSVESTAITYFYFDLGKQSVESALRRLLLQLSHQNPAACEVLVKQYDSCNGQTVPNYFELLVILEKMLASFGRTYLVLDALDECKKEDYDRLANFVTTISGWSNFRLHVLVTSQAREVFGKTFMSLKNLSRITPDSNTTSDDIRLYISSEFVSSSELQHWKQESGRITNYIVDKSAGMFRLAYCLLEQVKECARSDDLQATLDTLPDNLHDIYARSLKSVPEKYLSDVQKLLAWLAFFQRPLTLAQLEDTIAFDFSDSDCYTFDPRRRPKHGFFMKWLSVLVSVTTRSKDSVLDAGGVYRTDAIVSLAHSSVQDYLQRHPTWCNSCPIHVREDMAHRLIAQTCISYLLYFTDHPLDEDEDDHPLDDEESSPNYPLGTHAANNWSYHLRRSSDRDRAALSTLAKHLLIAGSWQYTALCCFDVGSFHWRSIKPPLCMCAKLGYIEGVKFLLEDGADINQRCAHGTALHYASEYRHTEIVEVLLEHGADVNAQGDNGTALQYASEGGHLEIVRILLKNGADVKGRDGRTTALNYASAGGHIEIVRLLLENGADVKAQDGDKTALQHASTGDHIEIIRLLLENGADVNAQGGGRRPALQWASANGSIEIVRLLLENDADVNAQGGDRTALQRASENGHIEVVRMLLENGADVNAQFGRHHTALQYASRNGHSQVVQLLLDNGATISNEEHQR